MRIEGDDHEGHRTAEARAQAGDVERPAAEFAGVDGVLGLEHEGLGRRVGGAEGDDGVGAVLREVEVDQLGRGDARVGLCRQVEAELALQEGDDHPGRGADEVDQRFMRELGQGPASVVGGDRRARSRRAEATSRRVRWGHGATPRLAVA